MNMMHKFMLSIHVLLIDQLQSWIETTYQSGLILIQIESGSAQNPFNVDAKDVDHFKSNLDPMRMYIGLILHV